MNTTDLLRTIGRVQYSIVSVPLHALDRAATRYLDAESPVRTTFERGVDALDDAADRFLNLSEPVAAGAAPSAPSAPTAPAASTPAPHRPSPESPRPAETATDVAPPIEVDEVAETHRVADELLEELEEAPLVGELAEAPKDEKQRMADLRAKHLVQEFEAEQAARHARFENS